MSSHKLMFWLSKIFKGSVNRVSRGRYNGNSHDGYSSDQTKSYGMHNANYNEDIDHAIALSILEEEDQKRRKMSDTGCCLDEDEQLARALQESLDAASPPFRNGPVEDVRSKSVPANSLTAYTFPSSGFRICAGCKNPIHSGNYLRVMDSVWHQQCLRCYACNKPISESEFSVDKDNYQYHKPCFKELFHPRCHVCKDFIPANKDGLIEIRTRPFWGQNYCPSHEKDSTPRCCSCERMEPKETRYITLDDGRKLCLECLNSAIMDNHECQPLYIDIQEFFEGLNMKVEQQVPLLLVERQALNEAMEAEKNGHHFPETRGLCLSEVQTVRTISRKPIIGPGKKIIDMITEPHELVRRCEVTAILILYGLPRLLTGSILAHEMMHAYLRLKGYRSLSPEVEEGICQVLGHMWLVSEITSGSDGSIACTSAASSSSSTSTSSKKGEKTDFEKKLGEFVKHQIEEDSSVVYGDGFKAGIRAVDRYGLKSTLDHIKMTGSFPC